MSAADLPESEADIGSPARNPVPAFIDAVLRGISQVMLQNHRLTGVLFLAGVCWSSWLLAAASLLGALAGTATALLLRADKALIDAGMFGFNAALTGIALLYFLQPTPLAFACVVLAAAASSILMAALLAAFARSRMPALTAPFVLVSLCVFLATARFGRLHATDLLPAASFPQGATVEGVVTARSLAEGVGNGIAQVFFQENLVTGAFFALGLLVASRPACWLALAGSLAGALVAWGMGAAEPAIRAGAYGFNSALVAIALGAVLLAPGWKNTGYALFAAAITPFVAAAVAVALAPLGMPAMTLPFVLVTWVFVLSARGLATVTATPA